METVCESINETEGMGCLSLEGRDCNDVQEIFCISDDEKTATPDAVDEGEHEKSCDFDKLPVDMREMIQKETKEWGQCIDFDSTANIACIKVDKLLSQPPLPPRPPHPQRPASAPPRNDHKLKELMSKIRDCEDSLSRYGILFEQAIQRIDGQLQYMENWQRNTNRLHQEIFKRTDALTTAVGVDIVKAKVQERENAPQQRPRQSFGGGLARGRELQFAMDIDANVAQQQHLHSHPLSENSYNRRGRGSRRGGRY